MKFNLRKWQWIVGALLTIIITWPYHEPDISSGIDGSYFAFFNHFFHFQLETLQYIKYPFGPLGFLYQPNITNHNLIFAYLFWTCIKFIVFYLLYSRDNKLLKTSVISSILFYAISKDFLLYTIVSFSLLKHNQNSKTHYLFIAGLISVIGILIKVNIGFICLLLLGSYSLFLLFYKKKWKSVIQIISLIVFFLGLLWFTLFQNLHSLFGFLESQYLYIFNNNDAMALFPPNNWLVLFIMMLCFLTPLLIQKKERITLLYLLHILVFFALFKYAFGRQENGHSIALFHFFIYFFLIAFSWLKKMKWSTTLLLITSVFLYSINLKHNQTFKKDFFPKYGGITAFNESVVNHYQFKTKHHLISEQNLSKNTLPQSMLDKIGNRTIDFFPWDLTYFIPNKLNYTPHQMLQTGGYPNKLVQENAEYLAKKGPEFILWEKQKWNGEVGSVDQQYLFNVDSDFLFEIINNYTIIEENQKVALLKRSTQKRLTIDGLKTSNASFENWIPVDTSLITRVKIEAQPTLNRKIQQAFYKSPRVQIEYLLANGKIVNYEITESSMKNGLWINPYIDSVNTDMEGKPCISFRLTQANWGGKFSAEFNVHWEFFSINN